MLNTLTPIQFTPFWYFVAFTEGWCKFACCLVLIWCSSEFTWNWFLFHIMNNRRDRICWEGRSKIKSIGCSRYTGNILMIRHIYSRDCQSCRMMDHDCPFICPTIFTDYKVWWEIKFETNEWITDMVKVISWCKNFPM